MYRLLVGLCKLAGWLPYRLLYYVFVYVIYFVLHTVVRYRVKVVRKNLANSFPEKSRDELRRIEREFYKNLSEIFIDNLTLCAKRAEKLKKRFVFEDIRRQENLTEGRTWICAMAHYGSWEYTTVFPMYTDHDVAAVYKPLHNETFEKFYKYLRARCGAEPVPLNGVAKKIMGIEKGRGKPAAIALIADQTPPWHEIHHWFNFLNQPAAFHMGAEKLALKFGLPVYFLHVEKVRRGYYRGWFEQIYDGEEKVAEYEITGRYVERLETMIRRCPELWLWSHKRWKHKPR